MAEKKQLKCSLCKRDYFEETDLVTTKRGFKICYPCIFSNSGWDPLNFGDIDPELADLIKIKKSDLNKFSSKKFQKVAKCCVCHRKKGRKKGQRRRFYYKILEVSEKGKVVERSFMIVCPECYKKITGEKIDPFGSLCRKMQSLEGTLREFNKKNKL